MKNIQLFTDELTGKQFVIIDRGNGEFTSMPKSVYDEQEEHLQTIVPQVNEASAE